MGFKERLKLLRKERGLYQQDLADLINKNKATISYYESGEYEPPLDVLITFANYFGVSMDYLTGESEYRHRIKEEELSAEIKELIHSGDIDYIEAIKDARQKGLSGKAIKEVLKIVDIMNHSEKFDKKD